MDQGERRFEHYECRNQKCCAFSQHDPFCWRKSSRGDSEDTWNEINSNVRGLQISSQGLQILLEDFERSALIFHKTSASVQSSSRANECCEQSKSEWKGFSRFSGKMSANGKKCRIVAPYWINCNHSKLRVNCKKEMKHGKCKEPSNKNASQSCNSEMPSTTVEKLLAQIVKNSRKATKLLKKPTSYAEDISTARCENRQRCQKVTDLEDVLRNNDKLHDFKDFLRKEKSEENLNFWLDAENYRSLKRGSFCLEAQRIFQMYFLSTSPYEINIDNVVKKWTQEKLEAPDSSTFELAQKHVFDLMKSDSFRRFAASRT